MKNIRLTSFLSRPRTLLVAAALLVAAPIAYAVDASADTHCGSSVSPLLRPALQQVDVVCNVNVPDGPFRDAAAKGCFASWTGVKAAAQGLPNIYELASGWESVAGSPAPYDARLLRAASADAKFVMSQIR